MSERISPPNRRHAERVRFILGKHKFYGTLGYHDAADSLPSELFLQGGKPGSDVESMCRDFAVVASLALQYGTPLETLRRAITRLDDGSAAGAGGRLLDLIVEPREVPISPGYHPVTVDGRDV